MMRFSRQVSTLVLTGLLLTLKGPLRPLGPLMATADVDGCVDYERYSHWVTGMPSGPRGNVVASGWYLYSADNGALSVFDLHAPTKPVFVGSVYTGQSNCRLVVAGKLVFVVGGESDPSTLQVIDVSTAASPVILGTVNIPGEAFNVAVAESYAYVIGSTGLHVIDVTSPSHPVLAGNNNALEGPGLCAVGSYVYTTTGGILLVVNASNPDQPAIVGGVPLPGAATVIRAVGSQLCVVGSGLQMIDIANPSAPVVVGGIDIPGSARDLSVTGSLACVVGLEPQNRLYIVDISSPSLPTITSTIPSWINPVSVAVAGSYAYVTANKFESCDDCDGVTGLQVVALSTLGSPPVVGTLAGVSGSVAVQGSHAFVAGSTDLKVLDVSEPSAPAVVGVANTGLLSDVAVQGSYAYVVGSSGLQVIDVSTPSAPSIVSALNTGPSQSVDVEGSFVYMLKGVYLFVVDVSTPNAPGVFGYVVVGDPQELMVKDSMVYVTTHGYPNSLSSLLIVDATNPIAPTVVYNDECAPGCANGVAIVGSRAYVSSSHDGELTMFALDNGNPALMADSGNLVAGGSFVYMLGQSLNVIDVSVPGAPRTIGNLSPIVVGSSSFRGASLAVAGPYAYLSSEGNFYVLPAQCEEPTTAVRDTPKAIGLSVHAYPNPFNPSTTVEYVLPSRSIVTVTIHGTGGERVATLVNHELRGAGTHTERWDGRTDGGTVAVSGIYFIRVEQPGQIGTTKVTLLK